MWRKNRKIAFVPFRSLPPSAGNLPFSARQRLVPISRCRRVPRKKRTKERVGIYYSRDVDVVVQVIVNIFAASAQSLSRVAGERGECPIADLYRMSACVRVCVFAWWRLLYHHVEDVKWARLSLPALLALQFRAGHRWLTISLRPCFLRSEMKG